MATAEVIAVEDLIAPISEDAPCGPDLRESGSIEYQELKDARRTIASLSRARKFDSQSDPDIDDNWRKIFNLAPDVLKNQAKDLEVAAWFTESAMRLKGFAGLRDGFQLIRRLVEEHWDGLYPLPDEDGLETKVYPITGLNGEDGRGTLIQPMRAVPLSDDSEPFTFNIYDRCNEASKITDPEAQMQRLQDIGWDMNQLQHQVNVGGVDFYRDLLDDLEAALEAFKQMSTLLDEKCGYQYAPPSSAIKKGLEEVRDAVKFLTRDKFPKEADEPAPAETEVAASGGGAAGTVAAASSVAVGAITNRAEAINQLLLIAEYFKKNEPHSPLCGAIERVAHWGKMSIQDLMLQLIPDDTARAVYSQLTGIPLGEDAPPIGALASMARPSVAPAAAAAPAPKEPASQASEPSTGGGDNWSASEDDRSSGW